MTRYEELVSLYMDGEPTQAELNELCGMLREDPELAKDLRDQLILWEAWSQEVAPERSVEAFMAAMQTRRKAERDAGQFSRSAIEKLKPRPRQLLFAPALAIAAAVAFMCIFYLIRPTVEENPNFTVLDARAQFVAIQGECVCTQCTLHQEGGHNKAIRYADAKGEFHLVMVQRDPKLRPHTKHFCGGPTPVLVKGNLIEEAGQDQLAVAILDYRNASADVEAM